jgi:hypothetical protein
VVSLLGMGCDNKSTASVDSFSDYGQFAISQSGLGHIMYSAATARSTMDFSAMPVDYGVEDSPPNGGKRPHHIVNSPSPLKHHRQLTSPRDPSSMNASTPRKLYYEEKDAVLVLEVWKFEFYNIQNQPRLKPTLSRYAFVANISCHFFCRVPMERLSLFLIVATSCGNRHRRIVVSRSGLLLLISHGLLHLDALHKSWWQGGNARHMAENSALIPSNVRGTRGSRGP